MQEFIENTSINFWREDARFENHEPPAVPRFQKVRSARLLQHHASNQTDRSAIRLHDSQNETIIPNDATYRKTIAFLYCAC